MTANPPSDEMMVKISPAALAMLSMNLVTDEECQFLDD
jgi:hypothetical protein